MSEDPCAGYISHIARIIDPGAFMKTATLYADMRSQLVAVRKARQILDLLQIKRVDDKQ